ncbi:MAG: hypothetical protein IT546_04850 [Caulobacteraceae bacterium]|nr:hypothetical protein [Caulobacteraceae bacterium]
MSDAEDKLAAFWAATEAPAADPVFVAEVRLRLSRRQALWRLVAITAWSLAAGVAAWSFAPLVEAGLGEASQAMAIAIGAASIGVLAAVFARRRTA